MQNKGIVTKVNRRTPFILTLNLYILSFRDISSSKTALPHRVIKLSRISGSQSTYPGTEVASRRVFLIRLTERRKAKLKAR